MNPNLYPANMTICWSDDDDCFIARSIIHMDGHDNNVATHGDTPAEAALEHCVAYPLMMATLAEQQEERGKNLPAIGLYRIQTRRLNVLIDSGNDDSEEATSLRSRMDRTWQLMTPEEQRNWNL